MKPRKLRALNVGIWIQLPPGSRWRTEGIGRLIGYIIQGTHHLGIRFTLVSQPWMEDELRAFIGELPRNAQKAVKLRISPGSRMRWDTIIRGRATQRDPIPRRSRLQKWLSKQLERPTYTSLVLGAVLLGAVTALRVLNPLNWIKVQAKRSSTARNVRDRLKNSRIASLVSPDVLIRTETQSALRFANKIDSIDLWLIPYPGFYFAEHLKKPSLLIFPDSVISDYPEGFDESARSIIHKNFLKTVQSAQRIVSFTDDVRTRHVVGIYDADPERTRVIPHAPTDISNLWNGPDLLPRSEQSLRHASSLIQNYVQTNLSRKKDIGDPRYWSLLAQDVDWTNLQFCFCPQQARPYKNLTKLVELAVNLNREQGQAFHLVISTHLDLGQENDPLVSLLNGLQAWEYVTITPALPADVHAALCHAATLVIHPSYFEGGFSFILGESVSMGTPCLLSKIPANLESLEANKYDYMLFDPSSTEELVQKTLKVLQNRDKFYELQRADVDAILERRGWGSVAEEYLKTFHEVADARKNR